MTLIEFPRPPRLPSGICDAIELLEFALLNLRLPKERRKLERIIDQLMKIEREGEQ